jgi:hypothetical protein
LTASFETTRPQAREGLLIRPHRTRQGVILTLVDPSSLRVWVLESDEQAVFFFADGAHTVFEIAEEVERRRGVSREAVLQRIAHMRDAGLLSESPDQRRAWAQTAPEARLALSGDAAPGGASR